MADNLEVVDNSKEIDEEVAKEWEHTMLQNTMGKELNELNKHLEEKEILDFKKKQENQVQLLKQKQSDEAAKKQDEIQFISLWAC